LFRDGKLPRLQNTLKFDTLKKIYDAGLSPIVVKVFERITNEESCNIEVDMIKIIGKRCDNKGPLSNLTDGGEGGDVWKNHPDIENYKKNMSKAISGERNGMYGRSLEFYPSHKASAAGNHWNKKKWSKERKDAAKNSRPKNWSATAKKVTVKFDEKELNFISIKEACKELNISYGGLLNSWDRIKDSKTTTYKKYTFQIC
jgi:hypothetical protein